MTFDVTLDDSRPMIIKDKSIHENEREHIRQFWKVIEEARIAALPYPNPINRKQRRANIAQERK
jgi:hypothetical protein|tara:strand:- start:6 stop:197 length:192 start_codon:yes stop_codon:yes gene_type:complete